MSNTVPVLGAREQIVAQDGTAARSFFRYLQLVQQAFGVGGPAPVTPTASPMVYKPTASSGYLFVAGGTVSKIEYSGDGTTFYDTGLIAGNIPLSIGASARITYTAPPTLTFVPGAA